ncbi:hypothetical protein [Rhizobium sullae]|uniref:Uncharacterized protein n=1 Tax=Rhizobium sullae TaxID=50338 RepID=A0ABY5XFW2_RHISU|nr:hypothetical protein [Rhizobium sullae]UWU13410.1 hypothetical protein N2599_14795 [Rhizobium sullae]
MMKNRFSLLHSFISLCLAVAVSAGASFAAGGLETEFIALGAVMGLAYRYWGPLGLGL